MWLSASEGKTWLKQQTIASLEGCARSRQVSARSPVLSLVNIEKDPARVRNRTRKDTWIAVLHDGSQVPVSRAGYAAFRKLVSR